MSLDLDALRSFVALSIELHFGHTAAKIHVSQPALSKKIKRLEAQLGGRLFDRTTGRVTLTPAGEALKERSRLLLGDAAALESFGRQAMRGEVGNLRIGFGIATINDLLPRAVIAFRKIYPGVVLELHDMPTRKQIDALLDGNIDVGFVRLPVINPLIETKQLLREELLIVAPANMFKGREVSLLSLRDEPFVLLGPSTFSTLYKHALTVCASAGFVPHIVQEVEEPYTVLNLVRAGLGVSLVPSALRRMRVPGIRFSPTNMPLAAWRIGIAWRRDRPSVVNHFADVVQSVSITSPRSSSPPL
jgi:DNA-binding transcriptional LysR family regulator